jgi:hypothetical protein
MRPQTVHRPRFTLPVGSNSSGASRAGQPPENPKKPPDRPVHFLVFTQRKLAEVEYAFAGAPRAGYPFSCAMKHLSWILLAVFCTALAQVRPVDPVIQAKHSCCECEGRCHMPQCALPAPHVPSVFLGEQSVQAALPKENRADRTIVEPVAKFFEAIAGREPYPVGSVAPRSCGRAASVPLFRVHCSFLI